MLNFLRGAVEAQAESYQITFPAVTVDQTGNIKVSDLMKRAQMGMPIMGDANTQYDVNAEDRDSMDANPFNVIGGLDLDDMIHLAERYSQGHVDELKNRKGELDQKIAEVKAQARSIQQPAPTPNPQE